MSKRSLSSSYTAVCMPVTEGKKRGRILELTLTPEGIRARFDGNAQWKQFKTKIVNPRCLTLWLLWDGKPGDVNMSPATFYKLIARVKGYNPAVITGHESSQSQITTRQ